MNKFEKISKISAVVATGGFMFGAYYLFTNELLQDIGMAIFVGGFIIVILSERKLNSEKLISKEEARKQ